MAILVESSTPDESKNFWATTWLAFYDAQHLYGRHFKTDVAAEPLTAKCKNYFTNLDWYDELHSGKDVQLKKSHLALSVERGFRLIGFDAFLCDWGEDWWLNPPFDLKVEFIRRAKFMQSRGMPGMMLLPYEPLAGWWIDNLATGCIVYEPDGRYQFYERDGETQKGGANFGSVLVAFPTMKIGQTLRIPFKRGIGGYIKFKEQRQPKTKKKGIDKQQSIDNMDAVNGDI